MSDVEVGATLTVDHHRPRSRGGDDDGVNLVYACPRCNEHKGSYWHVDDPPHVPLLHPGHDDLTSHVREADDGRLVGLTPGGVFFIEKLRLNRAPLVARRLALNAAAAQAKELDAARERVRELEMRILRTRNAVESTMDEIQRRSSPKKSS